MAIENLAAIVVKTNQSPQAFITADYAVRITADDHAIIPTCQSAETGAYRDILPIGFYFGIQYAEVA